jgi:hypothetical protein
MSNFSFLFLHCYVLFSRFYAVKSSISVVDRGSSTLIWFLGDLFSVYVGVSPVLAFLFPLPVLLDLASFSSSVELLKQSFCSLACASSRLCAACHLISYFIRIRAHQPGSFVCCPLLTRSSVSIVPLPVSILSVGQRVPLIFHATESQRAEPFSCTFLARGFWSRPPRATRISISSLICHQRP